MNRGDQSWPPRISRRGCIVEFNRLARKSFDIAQADDATSQEDERAIKTLTDLELVLAAGGDDIICWDPPR